MFVRLNETTLEVKIDTDIDLSEDKWMILCFHNILIENSVNDCLEII